MIRATKQTKKVDAILTSDWHLREDPPVCRTDDFNSTQWKKVDFISGLQKKYDCPIIHAGDLYHHWKPSPALLSETIKHLPEKFATVYGNHDLPQHNLELREKSGINVLQEAGILEVLDGTHWGQEPVGHGKILVWHVFTYDGAEPWPDCTAPKGNKLLKQYPEYSLIVTGDNHQPFVQEYKGRLLVNPGSLSRQRASETHLPRVYLYNAESNTVEPVYIPIEDNVISREHLIKEEQRNDRIDSFVSQLSENWKASLSFEDNLQKFEKKNKVRQSVMSIVYKSTEI